MAEILVANANLILLSVAIPFLLMTVFTLIRKSLGNSVTAMPDVLIFLSMVDFYFAIQPDPWVPMVHHSVKSFFQTLSFSLALVSIILFLFSLNVEKKLLRYWVKRTFPQALRLLPHEISSQRYPYFGITSSWFLIACLVAINTLPFARR